MTPAHLAFKREAELALEQLASKYNIGLQGVGVTAKADSVVVIARFQGAPTKPQPKGIMALFPEGN